MKFTPTLLATILGLSGAAQAAPLYSDDFNSLSNWTLLGDVTAYSGYGVVTTANTSEGDYANLSGNNPIEAHIGPAGIEAFVGLATGALDLSKVSQATEGSAIKRSFNVKAGDKLSVDWLLVTNDTGPGFGLDYGFAVIDGQLTSLASASSASAQFSPPYAWATEPGRFDYTFQRSGSISVAFGVIDVGDYSASTAFGIDRLSITAAVPEPSSYALLLAGLGLVGALASRRRG